MPLIKIWQTGVYGIRCKVTIKIYVGSTARAGQRFEGRFYRHKWGLRKGKHHSKHLQRAWDKYGEEAFDFFVIERCSPDKCVEREQYWIDYHDAANPENGYNISPTAGNCLGVKRTAETRAKVAAAGIGRPKSVETREKLRAARLGMKFDQQWRDNISAAARKRWETEDRKAWSKMVKAREVTDKMREANRTNGERVGEYGASQENRIKATETFRRLDVKEKSAAAKRSPTARKANSQRAKKAWADPVKRAKFLKARKNRSLNEKLAKMTG